MVHASAEQAGTPLACGEIGGVRGEDGSLAIGTGPGESPATRFRPSGQPYRTVNNLTIADSWADLTDGALDNGIYVTETGVFAVNAPVWTNTGADGAVAVNPGIFPQDCDDWTSTSDSPEGGLGRVGLSGGTDAAWTERNWQFCGPNAIARLYCFQQE